METERKRLGAKRAAPWVLGTVLAIGSALAGASLVFFSLKAGGVNVAGAGLPTLYLTAQTPASLGFDLVESLLQEDLEPEQAERELEEIIRSQDYASSRPSRGILYLKTHKTGSSTTASVFHRLASVHNLNCPVPPSGYDGRTFNLSDAADFIAADTMETNLTPNGRAKPWDIWTNHVIYHPVLEEMVPSHNGLVITSVRETYARQRSACFFYRCCPSINLERFDKWILTEGAVEEMTAKGSAECQVNPLTKQTVGAGIDSHQDFDANMEMAFERIRNGKWLAMISDRMLESQLVLKDLLNLHPLDTSYHTLKINFKKGITEASDEERRLRATAMVKEWNNLDEKLFQLANEALDNHLARIYPDKEAMQDAIDKLDLLNDNVDAVCDKSREIGSPIVAEWCVFFNMDNKDWIQHYRDLNAVRRDHVTNTRAGRTPYRLAREAAKAKKARK